MKLDQADGRSLAAKSLSQHVFRSNFHSSPFRLGKLGSASCKLKGMIADVQPRLLRSHKW